MSHTPAPGALSTTTPSNVTPVTFSAHIAHSSSAHIALSPEQSLLSSLVQYTTIYGKSTVFIDGINSYLTDAEGAMFKCNLFSATAANIDPTLVWEELFAAAVDPDDIIPLSASWWQGLSTQVQIAANPAAFVCDPSDRDQQFPHRIMGSGAGTYVFDFAPRAREEIKNTSLAAIKVEVSEDGCILVVGNTDFKINDGASYLRVAFYFDPTSSQWYELDTQGQLVHYNLQDWYLAKENVFVNIQEAEAGICCAPPTYWQEIIEICIPPIMRGTIMVREAAQTIASFANLLQMERKRHAVYSNTAVASAPSRFEFTLPKELMTIVILEENDISDFFPCGHTPETARDQFLFDYAHCDCGTFYRVVDAKLLPEDVRREALMRQGFNCKILKKICDATQKDAFQRSQAAFRKDYPKTLPVEMQQLLGSSLDRFLKPEDISYASALRPIVYTTPTHLVEPWKIISTPLNGLHISGAGTVYDLSPEPYPALGAGLDPRVLRACLCDNSTGAGCTGLSNGKRITRWKEESAYYPDAKHCSMFMHPDNHLHPCPVLKLNYYSSMERVIDPTRPPSEHVISLMSPRRAVPAIRGGMSEADVNRASLDDLSLEDITSMVSSSRADICARMTISSEEKELPFVSPFVEGAPWLNLPVFKRPVPQPAAASRPAAAAASRPAAAAAEPPRVDLSILRKPRSGGAAAAPVHGDDGWTTLRPAAAAASAATSAASASSAAPWPRAVSGAPVPTLAQLMGGGGAAAAAAPVPEPPVNLFCSLNLSCRNLDCTNIHFPAAVECPRYKGGAACRHWYGEHKQVKDPKILTTFGCNFASPAQVDFLNTHERTLFDGEVENALEIACPEIVHKDGHVFIHGLTPAGAEHYRARLPACVRSKIYPGDVIPRIVAASAGGGSTAMPPPRKPRNPAGVSAAAASQQPHASSSSQQELHPWQQPEYLGRPGRSENSPRTPTSTLAAAAGGGSTALPPRKPRDPTPHAAGGGSAAVVSAASVPPPRKLRNPPPFAAGGGCTAKPPHRKPGGN